MPSLIPKDRLRRVPGARSRTGAWSTGTKTALLFGALALIALLVALSDTAPSLRHVRVGFLSGSDSGNYHAMVGKFAAEVRQRKGQVENIASAGSVENIQRLIAGRARCEVHFALVQDGIDWPTGHQLELIGRMPRPEALIVLGRDADRIRSPQDLHGARLGIGPVGSGTEALLRRVIAPLAELELKVSTQPIDQQLDLLQRGELDLGAMVIDEDARLLVESVRERKLQILGIPAATALARGLPFARVGNISAGQYDYVRRFPPEDKQVLYIDTLVVGNGCASSSATQGMITAMTAVVPSFVRKNREASNLTGLPLANAARSYYERDGPDLVGEYLPWVIDLMPTATWIQLALAFSMLFNGMALWHRFRLWRIDAIRVDIERELPALFEPGITVGEIAEMPATDRHRTPEARAKLNAIVEHFAALSERCRRQSMSVLVPMGQEMAYRYQETLISDLLAALRAFRDRLPT